MGAELSQICSENLSVVQLVKKRPDIYTKLKHPDPKHKKQSLATALSPINPVHSFEFCSLAIIPML
jgi:hypothetical protein